MRTRLPVRVKVAVVTAALTFVILCLFAVVIGAVAERRVRDGFENDLRATAADLQDRLPVSTEGGELTVEPGPLILASAGDATVRVVALDGTVAFSSDAGVDLGPADEGVREVGDYRVVSRPIVAATREPPSAFPEGLDQPPVQTVAYLQYAKPEDSVQRTINRVRLFLAFGVVGGTVLAFLGGLLVAFRAMRPIAGLTRAAREVARTRDPDIALPKPLANDEVSDLAHTLEDMLRQLGAARGETEAALARQRDFVADASHELRTPLTSILANLELLEGELEGEQREMAGSALRSSRRMRRLVADLLLLARADAGRGAPHRPVDLAAVVSEAAAEAGALSAAHPLSLDLPQPVVLDGMEDDLHRMVANLIENAFVHTPGGTPVTASLHAREGAAVLEVADRGPGVPAALRERVFERFARGRGDAVAGGGSGLGLAIVRAVAEAHGGRVELLEAEGGGARFRVTLPATLARDGAAVPPAPAATEPA